MIQTLLIQCNQKEFAIPIPFVKQVRRITDLTVIPHSPQFVEGISHILGQPTVVINFCKKLGHHSDVPYNDTHRIIVLQSKNFVFGLLVDQVMDVIGLPTKNIQPISEMARPVDVGFIQEICDLNGRIIFILNIEQMLTETQTKQIKKLKAKIKEKATSKAIKKTINKTKTKTKRKGNRADHD